MFLKKQALLVFRGSPNPCFVIKTKFLLAKGKEAWLVFLGAYFAPLLIF
jgi:hypothetical protein